MLSHQIFHDLQQEPSNDPAVIEAQPVYHEDNESTQSREAAQRSRRKERKFLHAFRFWSIMGFTSTLMCTWELAIALSSFSLVDGGRGGFVWTYIGTMIAMSSVVASLAEITSMAPTHGGVYHWVSEFVPQRAQKYLGYVVGWMLTVAWQAGAAALNLVAAQLIQGIISMWQPDTEPPRWQVTLLTLAFGLLSTGFNTAGVKQLPVIELVILVLHFFGIFVVLAPLWALAPKSSAKTVFQGFEDNGGWGDIGVACMVGMIGSLFAFSRVDGAAHIGEKIRHASRIVPGSMAATFLLNGLLGILAVFTVAFSITDINIKLDISRTPSAEVVVAIFQKATDSKPLATVMTLVLVILIFGASLSVLATSARHIFAFAKDEGLPFPNLWRKVSRVSGAHDALPFNAFILSMSFTILVATVYLAYDDVLRFSITVFLSCTLTGYAIVLGFVLFKRLFSKELPKRHWSLGSFSILVNAFAFLYIMLCFGLSFAPTTKAELSLKTANWSGIVWVLIALFASVVYAIHGRYVFKGAGMIPSTRSFEELPSSRNT
ncbi:amino acid transporter [Microthyrium microscopicum]|uniref:Amino acid transporter n=1 Tax=Microthyrium microscopicum TaxID=703497 RepID=A0A6A6UUW1_9PEZI|nr:amino acid transporter [Microthyrium microscopicum]